MSILSFPERGPWGDNRYPGNCSGHIIRELLERHKPSFVIDVTAGSGTTEDVCRDYGVRALGLDLKTGFNILRQSVLEHAGEGADLTFSHPPYWDIIKYQPHADDLSKAESEEDFLEKLHLLLLNQREATLPGGHYVTLIGDRRKNGQYSSYQADCLSMMPKAELRSVLIKAQHNVSSAARNYALAYPRIEHEYLLVWQRSDPSLYGLFRTLANRAQTQLNATWKTLLRHTLLSLGEPAPLEIIYERVAEGHPEALEKQHWQEKVRQTLTTHPTVFQKARRGVWGLA